MRVTPQTRDAHRHALLRAAGRLFRAGGIGRVSVADITHEAGLTHGAFYGHFESKDALAAEACRDELQTAAQHWRDRVAAARSAGDDPLAIIARRYLSEANRDNLESSCALVALGAEVSRAPALVRAALHQGTEALLAVLEEEIPRARPGHPDPRGAALAMLAAMGGGLALARALLPDLARSRAALDAALATALAATEA
jgi:TetR/AcrR family transcriptional regulator, transcriptional repressor for nem operon